MHNYVKFNFKKLLGFRGKKCFQTANHVLHFNFSVSFKSIYLVKVGDFSNTLKGSEKYKAVMHTIKQHSNT